MRLSAQGLAARQGRLRGIAPVDAKTASVPPPVRGWNTILPLDAMEPEWAILLDNYFPQPGYIELRAGNVEHCDTASALPVETLMAYHGATAGDDRLFGATNGAVFDVTTATPAEVVSGLTNSRLQFVNFTTTGGKFLYFVNGADDPRYYDGATWQTPAITGVAAEDIVHINAHKNRLWFILRDTSTAAYLPVDSIQGAATTFELGGLLTKGGYIVAMGTWTRDGGAGPDDLAVFISSRGEIVVYAGTDPSTADTWQLVGVFEVGPPIGRRCMTRIGADLAIVSQDGVLPMSQIPGMERGAATRIALTGNIQPTMNEAARSWSQNFGWQLISYPRGKMAILNVPVEEGSDQQQYVMNPVTGAWCRFIGWNANCWEVFEDRLFFGGNDGVVYEADRGGSDAGMAIEADMKGAFNYFGSRGQLKRWTMLRAKNTTGALITPGIALNVDFRDDAQVAPGSAIDPATVLWDDAVWDEAIWPEEQFFRDEWQSIVGIGYCASLRMRVSVMGDADQRPVLRVNGFDYVFAPGGVI